MFLFVLNFLVCCGLAVLGIFFFINSKYSFTNTLQLNITLNNTKAFCFMVLLSGILMYIIFKVNRNLGLIEIINTKENVYLLKEIPTQFISSCGEEILVRGLVFVGILRVKNNKTLALWVSSLIFCFLHRSESFLGILSYFLAGIMYGLSFLKFHTIWASIGLHFAWNYFQGSVFNFPVSGIAQDGFYITTVVESQLWNGGHLGIEYSFIGILSRIVIIIFILIISRLLNKASSEKFLITNENKLNV